MQLDSVLVIGGGAWGTALAQAAAMAGRGVTLLVRDAAQADEINQRRTNRRYLGDQLIHPAVRATLAPVPADMVILAVPAQSSRTALGALDPSLLAGKPVILSAKGLETGTLER